MKNEEYRMNDGRNARYKFEYSRRDTGEVIISGIVTGGNKTDCRKAAYNKALDAGLHPLSDDNIKFFIRACED